MTLVTLHLAPGQTLKQLMEEISGLSGGAPLRTVTGRTGVLVGAEVAHRYLMRRFGHDKPVLTAEAVAELTERLRAEHEQQTAPVAQVEAATSSSTPTPTKPRPAKKAVAPAKSQKTEA